MHLRDAWNGAIGTDSETRFEHQEIVLTVPASFDEEARELTVEAARSAGLDNLPCSKSRWPRFMHGSRRRSRRIDTYWKVDDPRAHILCAMETVKASAMAN